MSITEESKRDLCKRLWLENEPKLRKLCTYKLNSHPDEVDDVLAEAALILWKAIYEEKLIEYPQAWLYKVTDNLIKKKYTEINTEKERKQALEEENLKTYNLSVGYDFENFLLTDEALERILTEIESQLTDDERQLYNFIYEDELKMKEIAVKLSSTESAVKQKNYRLTRKIKQLVKEYLEKL